MPSVADEIAAAVTASGPLRFDHYVRIALYGAAGFYVTGGVAGRRGDFITSPEVGPLFGTVLARYIASEWERMERPNDFVVMEVGAGPGTLARSITVALAALGVPARYVAVEVSAAQRSAHPPTVVSLAATPTEPMVGVVIANELLDNLPFRLLVFDDGWREAFVHVEHGRCIEVLGPLAHRPRWLPERAPLGARVPWQQEAQRWVGDTLSSITGGSLVAFDYVSTCTADLATGPWRQWLRTYRRHERGSHYLDAPGSQDITAQVALDQLPSPTAVRTQEQFLLEWGIDELVEEGRQAWAAAASAPTVAAMTMRSRIREAEALLDPAGLGAFLALTWSSPTAREVA